MNLPESSLKDFNSSVDNLKESKGSFVESFIKSFVDDCEDCEDLLSPCCGSPLQTVFGSLPLKVSCQSCEKLFVLRELI